MKRVVSVSLGSSKRDKAHVCTILGQEFTIERRGTDGDKARFRQLIQELDGQVAALGVGGADIYLATDRRKYVFKEVADLVSGATRTPVVDGSGLKHTLERETIHRLQSEGTVVFKNERVLLVSAVDRYGMAQALDEVCPNVVYGDFLFGLGLPIPIRSYKTVVRLAGILLPVVTRLPFQLFYPTGSKQDERKPKFTRFFDEASFICGDWHYIRRYAPDKMQGKTILTQTLRKADLEWLATTGVARAITTTPDMGGETFATNVMEGVIVTLAGKSPAEMTDQDYLDVLGNLGWKPNVLEFDSPVS